jgi:O-antigen/teichoic acid export membrane protein
LPIEVADSIDFTNGQGLQEQREPAMKDLREKTIRGGVARLAAQAANFVMRVVSLMVLARLLSPKDFGLVGMATAFTGILNLFRDFGLSTASVQQTTVTDEQISTLFWINLAVGFVLGGLLSGAAPLVAAFYHEPRLAWVTVVLASGFLFNAAGVQHAAILQRQMRFTALAVTNTIGLVVSTVVGMVMAKFGYGYWALVGMTTSLPLVTTLGIWAATAWVPGMPRRGVGLQSMMRFGGAITLNGVVVYFAYNLEKVLLGRFWGAQAVGIYGRSYQLVNIPTDNLNSAVGEVAFSALSRVKDEPSRLKAYFLKGYSLVLALTIPMTFCCALFAKDLISVLLGPKWNDSVPIFRLLTPTILVFAIINPFSWLLFSIGKVGRSLKIALVLTPVVITGYVLGLPYGPKGVALGYSVASTLWVLPHIAWCVRDTNISFWDAMKTLGRPFLSGAVASILPMALQFFYLQSFPPFLRLALGVSLFLLGYLGMLFYVMGEKAFYLNLLRGMRKGPSIEEKALASG